MHYDLTRCLRLALYGLLALPMLAIPLSVARGQLAISTTYATGCGAGTGCGQIWFTILNTGSTDVALNTLAFTRTAASYAFSPVGGVGSFDGQDDLGPLAGFTTVSSDGSQVFIDFVNTGDPLNPGFPFTVFAGGTGQLETTIDPAHLPTDPTTLSFAYVAASTDGSTIEGVENSVSTAPEPSSLLLLATGFPALAVLRRLRRRAAACFA